MLQDLYNPSNIYPHPPIGMCATHATLTDMLRCACGYCNVLIRLPVCGRHTARTSLHSYLQLTPSLPSRHLVNSARHHHSGRHVLHWLHHSTHSSFSHNREVFFCVLGVSSFSSLRFSLWFFFLFHFREFLYFMYRLLRITNSFSLFWSRSCLRGWEFSTSICSTKENVWHCKLHGSMLRIDGIENGKTTLIFLCYI